LHRRAKHEYVVLQLYTPSLFKDQESYDSLHLRVIGFNDVRLESENSQLATRL